MFTIIKSSTPAPTKMLAAIATPALVGFFAHTTRMTKVVIRAMQKPNVTPDGMKRIPRLLLTWKMVMCVAARQAKMAMRMAEAGTSCLMSGRPPMAAF